MTNNYIPLKESIHRFLVSNNYREGNVWNKRSGFLLYGNDERVQIAVYIYYREVDNLTNSEKDALREIYTILQENYNCSLIGGTIMVNGYLSNG